MAEVLPTSGPQHWDCLTVQCTSPWRGGELVGVCGCAHECRESGISRRWTACLVFIAHPPLEVAVCLSPDWRCVLRQPAASQVYLLYVTWLTTLMLLIKVSAMVIVHRRHHRTLFFLPGIIFLFITWVGIIWNNSLPVLRFEPWLLSTLCTTAHGAQVLWPLGYMGR